MKKCIALILIVVSLLTLTACSLKARRVNTIEGNVGTYYELSDGTWKADKQIYKYRLEIKGMIPSTTYFTTFVYLSNLEEITFERAWAATVAESEAFDIKEAVLVESMTDEPIEANE